MAQARALLLAWIAIISLICVNASRLEFSSSPAHTSRLTETLVLRCSLHDTPEIGGPVGRRQADIHQVSSLVNLHTVSSVLVTRAGDDVASLTQASRPLVLSNSSSLQVAGSLTPAREAHLTLTWPQPTTSQAGDYVCEINGIDDVGHSVRLSRPLQVTHGPPSVDDLVDYVVDMEVKVSDLEARLNRSQHIESGTIFCGESRYWYGRSGSYFTYKDIHQSFQREYEKPPRVMVNVMELHDNNPFSVWAVYLRSVDLAGFGIRCQTWNNYVFKTLTVTWISIPDTS